MNKVRIITDSASDISVEAEKNYNIFMVPFPVVLGDKSYISRVDFDNEGFYKLMAENDDIPKTSQITVFQFDEIFKQQFDEGYTDVIYVSINSKGSSTYENAVRAKDEFFDEHPECKGVFNIYVHDGIGYNGYYGYPVEVAAKMALEGKTAEEINTYLDTELPKRRIYFGIYLLKYAAKSGRIPSAAALVGDALGVKPIMKIWDNEIVTAAKCRGEKKLISKIVEMTINDMEPGSEYQIVYGNDESVRDELAAKLTEAIGYGPVEYFQIGAAVAANAGPRVVGAIFSVKKELMK